MTSALPITDTVQSKGKLGVVGKDATKAKQSEQTPTCTPLSTSCQMSQSSSECENLTWRQAFELAVLLASELARALYRGEVVCELQRRDSLEFQWGAGRGIVLSCISPTLI